MPPAGADHGLEGADGVQRADRRDGKAAGLAAGRRLGEVHAAEEGLEAGVGAQLVIEGPRHASARFADDTRSFVGRQRAIRVTKLNVQYR